VYQINDGLKNEKSKKRKKIMNLSKELKAKIKSFAAGFSYDDWSFLNTKMDFLDAIEAGEFGCAAAIADEVLKTKCTLFHQRELALR
jgi:hypothetical protein